MLADSYFSRLKGLMFKKEIDYGLLIRTKLGSSIHTCFMLFPIDVYFIKNKEIIEKTTLNPWSFYKPVKEADFILEFRKDDFKIKKEDEILIIQNNQEYLKVLRKY
ncbi:DUF192 domain-containing protein [Methanobrevibacter sp.]|uniref:DUF192 domain-containing protein n=1 Tax=Methanobrevibacter sp. TaxID=66852 RepID=UPI0026DFB5BF|nr:DUF192 domain-containing protein [Methanobrevibacter sp.]